MLLLALLPRIHRLPGASIRGAGSTERPRLRLPRVIHRLQDAHERRRWQRRVRGRPDEQTVAKTGADGDTKSCHDAARDAAELVALLRDRRGVEHLDGRLERRAAKIVPSGIAFPLSQAMPSHRERLSSARHGVRDERQVPERDGSLEQLVELVDDRLTGSLDAENREHRTGVGQDGRGVVQSRDCQASQDGCVG